MKRSVTLLILFLILAAFGGGMYYLYSKEQEKPVAFETEQPFRSDIIHKTVATGSVTPRKEVEIKPQVSGVIEKIYVEPGEKLNAGDLIASIRIIPDMVSLNNAENRLNRARLALDNARRDYERNKPLRDQGVIAEAAFQPFELALRNAEEELTAASDNLDLIRKGSTTRSGKTGNTNVRSTIRGMVLAVPVEEGNSVIEANTFNAGTTIASVADMNEMIFKGKVDESEVGKLSPGMKLLLTIGAIDKEQYVAELEYISPKGVVENGAVQFEIRAALRLSPGQFVRAGYSANADIVLDRRDSVLAISESLLQFEGDSAFVEVETQPGVFERRAIQTGLSDGIQIEVLGGVGPGDKIKNPNRKIEP
jgi:HlyD family secretion protein